METRRSPQPASQPVAPCPPIRPSQPHSSLAFSQLRHPAGPTPSTADDQIDAEPAPQTPSRPISNIGRKRALMSPLARSTATPGHVSQMQRIFEDAKASLQLDAAIASSPAGSMASRLPSAGKTNQISRRRNTVEFNTQEWRYSTAPQQVAESEVDVREPFPTESPRLPDHHLPATRKSQMVAREPISSGFTSPVAGDGDDLVMKDENPLPPLPTSSPPQSGTSQVSPLASFHGDHLSTRITAVSELEQPMTKMHVSHVDAWLDGVLEDSPNAQREQRRRSKSAKVRDSISANFILLDITANNKSRSQGIILSTTAKAAAESAKLKRDLLVRKLSNKENIPPASRGGTPIANFLSVPILQITPSPDFPHGSPPPSPTLDAQLPPAPPFRRVDSSGSPFPLLKAKSSPPAEMRVLQQQRPGYYSSPPPAHQQFASPPQQPHTSPPYHQQHRTLYSPAQRYQAGPPPAQQRPFPAPPLTSDQQPPIPNSQQLIYLHGPPPPAPLAAPHHDPRADPPCYSFSTAAAAHSGSSPAPECRIRDAYRTDTLTPFEVPTARFRKIGLGVAARTRGVKKYYGHHAAHAEYNPVGSRGLSTAVTAAAGRAYPDPDATTSGAVRPRAARPQQPQRMVAGSRIRSPDEVRFRSSPAGLVEGRMGGFHAQGLDRGADRAGEIQPRRKKLRMSVDEKEVGMVRDEDEGMVMVGSGIAVNEGPPPEMMERRDEHYMVDMDGNPLAMQGYGEVEAGESADGDGDVDVDVDAADTSSSVQALCGNESMLFGKNGAAAITPAIERNLATAVTPGQNPVWLVGDGDEREGVQGGVGMYEEEPVRKLSPHVVTRQGKGKGASKKMKRIGKVEGGQGLVVGGGGGGGVGRF